MPQLTGVVRDSLTPLSALVQCCQHTSGCEEDDSHKSIQEAFITVQTMLSGNSLIPSPTTAYSATHSPIHTFFMIVCVLGRSGSAPATRDVKGRGHRPALGKHFSGLALYRLLKNQDWVPGSTKESHPVCAQLFLVYLLLWKP